jgi:hypothetical protein
VHSASRVEGKDGCRFDITVERDTTPGHLPGAEALRSPPRAPKVLFH